MEIEECRHGAVEDGVCTGCGLCAAEGVLADEIAPARGAPAPRALPPMRYAVADKSREYSAAAQRILVPLGITGYRGPLLEGVRRARFRAKLSREDKLLVVLYHVLREDGFPIALDDLLEFSKLDKYRFLKVHRETFPFLEETRGYLEAVYRRTAELIKRQSLLPEITAEGFLELRRRHPSAAASDICLAAMLGLRRDPVLPGRLCIVSKRHNERIRKIMKKLGHAQCK